MVCDNSYESCKYSSDYYDNYSSSNYYSDSYYGDNLNRFSSSRSSSGGIVDEFNQGYLCDINTVSIASGMGGFTFLCAILFALQGLRILSNVKRGIPVLHFKSSRGLAEIAVMLTTLFVTIQLILGWAEFGLLKNACSIRNDASNIAGSLDYRDAMIKLESAYGSLRTLAHTLPAIVAFTFLPFWFARLSNSLQFTVFRLGISRGNAGRIILYFQYLLCALGIIVTGITIPAIFGSIDLYNYEYGSSMYDMDWNTLAILLILHLVADILFIITSMILTSLTSQHAKRLNQNPKARSLWTLNIISIIPPVACLITIRIPFGLIICLGLYFLTYYFALVLAYLPGYRFWRKTWRDAGFDDDLASTANGDEERGTTQPEMAERATPAPAPGTETRTETSQETSAPELAPVVPEVETGRISVESDAKTEEPAQVQGGEPSKNSAARYA